MRAHWIGTILILGLVIGLAHPVRAHEPPEFTYHAFQWPDALLPTLDGDVSDWEIVPEPYILTTEDLYEQLQGLGKRGSGYDESNMAVECVVGWNQTTNRLWIYTTVYDNITVVRPSTVGPGPMWHYDSLEIAFDADHSGGQFRGFSDLPEEENKRLRQAQAQKFNFSIPSPDEYEVFIGDSGEWYYIKGGELFDWGWSFDGVLDGAGTRVYEWSWQGWDDLNWEGPDKSRVHDLREGEIVGFNIAWNDPDEGPGQPVYWTLCGADQTFKRADRFADVLLAELESGLPDVDPRRSFVSNVSVEPMKPSTGGSVNLSAEAADLDDVSSVVARIHSSDATVDVSVPMTDQGAGTYAATWTTEPDPKNYLVDIIVEDGTSHVDTIYAEASFWTTNVPPFVPFSSPERVFPNTDVYIDAYVIFDLDLDAVEINTEIKDPDTGEVVATLPGGSGTWRVPADPAERYIVAVTAEDERSGITTKERELSVLIPQPLVVLSNPVAGPTSITGEGLKADFVAVDQDVWSYSLDNVEPTIDLGPEGPAFIDAASAIMGPIDLHGSDFPFGNGVDYRFVSRFEGFINIAEPDTFTFIVDSDDDSRLLIGGVELSEQWCCDWGPANPVEFTVPGLYPMKLLHIEGQGAERLSLHYARGLHVSYDSDVFSPVPAEMLFPEMPGVILSVAHEVANPGGVAVVPVLAKNVADAGIVSGELTFRFDSDVLTFIEAKPGRHRTMYLDANSIGAGEARVVFAAGSPLTDVRGGVLVTAAFKVHPNAARGLETPITLEAAFNEGEHVPITSPGSVLIDLVGDASRNGDIKPFDAALILKHTIGALDLVEKYFDGDRRFCMLICDATRDGTLAPFDSAVLLQFMVGKIPGLPYPGARERPKVVASASRMLSISDNIDYSDGKLQATIDADDLRGVLAGGWTVVYDATQLRVLSVSPEDGLSGALFEHAVEEGKARMAFASAELLEIGGALASLVFEILPDAEGRPESALLKIQDVYLNEGLIPSAGGEWDVSLGETATSMAYALSQNFPNPFNPQTTIHYTLARSVAVESAIYDVNGQRIRILVDGLGEMGAHTATWDGRDDAGEEVASGVYFCRLHADGFVDTRKLVFVR